MKLTDTQRDLLQTAVEEGYFKAPRRATVVDVGEEHGISSAEASEQIREGLDEVLRKTNISIQRGGPVHYGSIKPYHLTLGVYLVNQLGVSPVTFHPERRQKIGCCFLVSPAAVPRLHP